MGKNNFSVSRYIKNSLVKNRLNLLLEKIITPFSRKIDFDKESLSTLEEYSNKGKLVFISYQSSNPALIILNSLFRRHGYERPELALDYRPYLTQVAANILLKAFRFIRKNILKKQYERISDYDFITRTLDEKRPVVLALLSRELFLRRYLKIRSDSLQYLIEGQMKSSGPIFLFPQIMFWNRNPERTRAFFTSRATGDRGLISALFTILKSATPPFMRISPPLNLQDEISAAGTDDVRQIARRVRDRLLEIYHAEKRSVLGPVIKSQQEMMEKVLYHKNVLDEINSEDAEGKASEKKLRKKALKYFKEIAADFSIIYIRWFERTLRYVFSKIFNGIEYNIEDFKMLREAAQKGPLIIMPAHRSHMDYLIVSSIFYRNKLIPPHIVAGSNLTFFPMGKIFRRSGAFFMRRSFKGIPLYAMIFRQYLKSLISEGYSIEFFIEGTRTRTGKLFPPKMGILKYLIESIEEGYNRDMMLVPTSIGYDRILEESAYRKEIAGKQKKAESTSSFFKSRRLLQRKYGKVYLSFDKPVSYQEFKEKHGESADLTTDLGWTIIKKISDIVMVNPFSITSTAILTSTTRGFTRDMLKEKIAILLEYLNFSGARLSPALQQAKNYDEIIDYVIESYEEDGIIEKPGGDVQNVDGMDIEGLYILNEGDRARIVFYKNSSIHLLLPIAYTALSLLRLKDRPDISKDELKAGCEELQDLFYEEFIYPDTMNSVSEYYDTTINYLEKRGVIRLVSGKVELVADKDDEFVLYARTVQDFLESYFVVCESMGSLKGRKERRDLIQEIRKDGVKLFHLGVIKLIESLSLPNYNNGLHKLAKLDFVTEEVKSKKNVQIDVSAPEGIARLKKSIQGYLKYIQ